MSGERKLKEFIASKPGLRELLWEVLQTEGNRRELGKSGIKEEHINSNNGLQNGKYLNKNNEPFFFS